MRKYNVWRDEWRCVTHWYTRMRAENCHLLQSVQRYKYITCPMCCYIKHNHPYKTEISVY